MNSKICTSIEQSKILIELGIDVNTADMRYGYIAPYDYSDRMYDGGYDEVPYPKDFLKKNPNFSENEYDGELPAWSLSALLQLMPKSICIKQSEHSGYFYFLEWQFANDNSLRYVGIDSKCLIDIYSDHDVALKDDIDTAFEMVCWLKENKKI